MGVAAGFIVYPARALKLHVALSPLLCASSDPRISKLLTGHEATTRDAFIVSLDDMTERIVDALLKKSGLRTIPRQPASSFGNCIGHIDNSALCWELVGELREQFDYDIFPKVRAHLETIFESGQRGECLTISV